MHFPGQKVKQRLAGCHFVFKTLPSTSQDGHKSYIMYQVWWLTGRTSNRNDYFESPGHCEALYFCHSYDSYVSNHVSMYIITSMFHNLSLSIIQIPHDFQCSKISELTPRNRGFRPVSESILSKSWKRALRSKRTRKRRASCASRVPRHPKNAAWYPGSGISLRQTACHIGDAVLSHTQGMDSSIICDDQSRLKELGNRCIQNACMPQRSKVKIESEWKWQEMLNFVSVFQDELVRFEYHVQRDMLAKYCEQLETASGLRAMR